MTWPAAFTVAGAASRHHFLFIETRLQITTFCLAAIAIELSYVVTRLPYSKKRLALNISCATLAIVATRWLVEAPPWIDHPHGGYVPQHNRKPQSGVSFPFQTEEKLAHQVRRMA
jgi:hypothetical protein